jgi:carboxymethylenebutenolidase
MGKMIEFPAQAGQLAGYLAEPAPGTSNGRGVVVLQEWWGLVPHICDVADRFAGAGYTALAPDLWRGDKTSKPDEAERMFMALDIGKAESDLRGAVAEVARLTGSKVAVVGLCMGGQLALLAATVHADEVACAVDFYGIHPNVKPNFDKLACPVLGIFGAQDPMVTPEVVSELVRTIEAAGQNIDYTIFDGCSHAFFNDSRPEVYRAGPAAEAWSKTLGFLEQHRAP